jgi:hypothetical protein
MGEEQGRRVYKGLPRRVETPEDFQEFIEEQKGEGLLGSEMDNGDMTERGDQPMRSEEEPVVGRTDEQVALENLFRAAKPAIAEYMSSQEEQRRIEKEEREKKLKFEERSERRWQVVLGVIVGGVVGLTIYFGEKSANLGLQIFTHITTAAIGGLGGFGIGHSWGEGRQT